MAQLVGRLTLAQVIISQLVSSSPVLGSVLTAQSLEPALDSVSLSRSALPCLSSVYLSFSVSRINKTFLKIKKKIQPHFQTEEDLVPVHSTMVMDWV